MSPPSLFMIPEDEKLTELLTKIIDILKGMNEGAMLHQKALELLTRNSTEAIDILKDLDRRVSRLEGRGAEYK